MGITEDRLAEAKWQAKVAELNYRKVVSAAPHGDRDKRVKAAFNKMQRTELDLATLEAQSWGGDLL